MQLMIGIHVDMPDAVVEKLLAAAGVELPPADYPLALALATLTPMAPQLREYLLTPDHAPVQLNTETLITTERSAARVTLVLTTPDEDAWPWNESK